MVKEENKKTWKKASVKEKPKEDIKNEDSEELEESELEEEVETEDIRFRELDSFLQSLSGFNQGVVNPVTNLERGVSGFRLPTREDSHDAGFKLSGSSWHRTDVRKSDENTESMSQKARVNYEIGEKKESIFESQDRKYKIRK